MNRPIQLLRVRDGQVVDAILTEVTQKHLNDAATLWEPLLQSSGAEDEYWDWVAKSHRATLLLGDELYAIECDGVTQGFMTIDVLKKRCQIRISIETEISVHQSAGNGSLE